MIRKIAGLLILLFVASLSIGAQDKKDTKKVDFLREFGDFESYKDKTLTLRVEGKEKEFKVPGDTPVGYMVGAGKLKTVKAKDYLKDVKKGSLVSVTLTLDGKKVLGIGVTDPPQPKAKEDKEKEKE